MSDEQTRQALEKRLRTIAEIARCVLGHDPAVRKDERNEPEMRDVLRIAQGNLPRTEVGKRAFAEASEG